MTTNGINTGLKKYLLWFAHEHVNFRKQEIKALATMFNINLPLPDKLESPFLVVENVSESLLRKMLSRSVLIRSLLELWGEGKDYNEVHQQLKSCPSKIKPYENDSYRVTVETFGKKQNYKDKIQKIERFDYLPLKGPIQLNNPQLNIYLFEYYGLEPNKAPPLPHQLFIGKWICDSQRAILPHFSLAKRNFIGNTSMDPTLSFCMATMAQVQPGHLVLDPFVGSGSLLVAAAQAGAWVLGTDIDYLMLHGKAKPSRCNEKKRKPDESIRVNLKQYGLESKYLDILVADSSMPLWRDSFEFDAIITDPPYGIREATEKIGTQKCYQIPDHLAEAHIPSKVGYDLKEVVQDLLMFSANHLKLGGHLVFWLPHFKKNVFQTPHHPALKLIAASEQALSGHTSRYLLTYIKQRQPQPEDMAAVSSDIKNFRQNYFQPLEV